jgi:DNA-binding IclR family transcriptional regulator
MGVAAPIRDADGAVVAAVSIAALAYRVPGERVPQVVAAVEAAAGRISDRLQVIEG